MPARRSFEAFCSERGTMEPAMTPDDVIPLHLADVTYPASHPLAGQDGPVLGFAIRHPYGIVLVDTGVGEGDEWVAENYRPRIRDVREALSAAKLDPDSVRAIVNSHLHFDHCGQNRAFPGIPIHVQQAELDLALREGHTVVEWVDFPDARYEAVGAHARAPVGHRARRRRPRADRGPGGPGRALIRDRRSRRQRAPSTRAECRPHPLLARPRGPTPP